MLDQLLAGAPVLGAVRVALLAATLLVIGTEVVRRRLLPVLLEGSAEHAGRVAARLGRVERGAVLVLALVLVARLAQQSAAFADEPAAWPGAVPLVLQHTMWGKGWFLQVVSLVGVSLTRGGGWRSMVRWLALAGLAVAPALAGHAIGAPRLSLAAVMMDATHVAAAGIWVGTLAAAVLSIAPDREGVPAPTLLSLLTRFSPLALASAAALGATGTFASWLHVETLEALWSTPYGRMVLLKVGATAAVAAAGAFNWRVATPRLATRGETRPLFLAVTLELLLAAALLVVTSLLIVTPLPSEG